MCWRRGDWKTDTEKQVKNPIVQRNREIKVLIDCDIDLQKESIKNSMKKYNN